jgi:hypothetical protein
MAYAKIEKQPSEKQDYVYSFAGKMMAGETMTLVSFVVMNLKTGNDESTKVVSADPSPSVVGQEVFFWLEDGTDGDSDNINIQVVTSRGQKLEGNLWLSIAKEKPPPGMGA